MKNTCGWWNLGSFKILGICFVALTKSIASKSSSTVYAFESNPHIPFFLSQDLCGSGEEKLRSNTVSDLACCSFQSDIPEAKPHSYLEAIRCGLEEEDSEPGSLYTDGEQLCPYAAAGTCQFGDRCLYLHGQVCEICGLQVLHPFDPEQRKTHEKVMQHER